MTRKATVLIVDDEEPALRMFEKTFRNDFNVLTASSAKAAMEVMESTPVDVVLADQMMPVETGATFLESAGRKFPTVLRGIITAYANFKDALIMAGIEHIVLKPYESDEVRKLVSLAHLT